MQLILTRQISYCNTSKAYGKRKMVYAIRKYGFRQIGYFNGYRTIINSMDISKEHLSRPGKKNKKGFR